MQPDRGMVPLLENAGYRAISALRPRSAREIGASPWGIGCETLDRDYVDYTQTIPHLGELGATQARLQGGWAKCDPGEGSYNWAWLDAIVDGCLAQGVKPWIETSYGNPAYPGGGGIGLSEGIPTSPVALAAWDRWVRALVERYRDRLDTWEIWNEPDLRNAMSPADYAAFFIRTATIIRSVQPAARIVGLALAGNKEFAQVLLDELTAARRTDLLNEITFHFYPHNPDDAFELVTTLREMLAALAPHVTLRQGETGAPSETQPILALRGHPWNERKQAAWNLRRLLAHHVRGIPMSLFQLADMQYTTAQGAKIEGRNSKGLLQINPDKTVAYRKPAYFAAQHLFSLLDGAFALESLPNLASAVAPRTCAYAWRRRDENAASVIGWWRADAPPLLEAPASLGNLALEPASLRDPLLVDLMSGTVFAPPAEGAALWSSLPCADVPLLLAEKRILPLQGEAQAVVV